MAGSHGRSGRYRSRAHRRWAAGPGQRRAQLLCRPLLRNPSAVSRDDRVEVESCGIRTTWKSQSAAIVQSELKTGVTNIARRPDLEALRASALAPELSAPLQAFSVRQHFVTLWSHDRRAEPWVARKFACVSQVTGPVTVDVDSANTGVAGVEVVTAE